MGAARPSFLTRLVVARPTGQQSRWSWLDVPVEAAARRLLGCEIETTVGGEPTRVRIVETEAYDQDDPASHSFVGRTARNDAMFRAAGHAYVYLNYGIHRCLNVVTGVDGHGSGVLIRAGEPLVGADVMERRRGRGGIELTNGPGKLGQALAIELDLSGHDLADAPLRLVEQPPVGSAEIVTSARIGITKAADAPRRFYLADSPYVTRR